MTKNKNKKSSEAAKQEAFKLSDGICYCKTPAEAYICSQKIVEHIEEHYQCRLSADEKMYLIIYVKRLMMERES